MAIVQEEPERRCHLLALARLLGDHLQDLGYSVGNSRCQIVPLVIGETKSALAMSRWLEECGLLVPAIRPPSVPEGTARLRISLTAGHSEEDVMRLVSALRECRSTVSPIAIEQP